MYCVLYFVRLVVKYDSVLNVLCAMLVLDSSYRRKKFIADNLSLFLYYSCLKLFSIIFNFLFWYTRICILQIGLLRNSDKRVKSTLVATENWKSNKNLRFHFVREWATSHSILKELQVIHTLFSKSYRRFFFNHIPTFHTFTPCYKNTLKSDSTEVCNNKI